MNRDSVQGRRIKDPSAINDQPKQPGDYAWEFDFTHFEHGTKPEDEELTFYFCLPGENYWSPIHVRRGAPPANHVWGWDGNFDFPTFSPSIEFPGHWHGYCESGRFRSV